MTKPDLRTLTLLLAKISEYLPKHDRIYPKNALILSVCLLIKKTVNRNAGPA